MFDKKTSRIPSIQRFYIDYLLVSIDCLKVVIQHDIKVITKFNYGEDFIFRVSLSFRVLVANFF